MKTNLYKRPAALIMVFVLLLAGLLLAVPKGTKASAATGEDIIFKDGCYLFGSESATRFWLDIPLNGIEGDFNGDAMSAVVGNGKGLGLAKKRSDYNVAINIRINDLKYKDSPILFQGNTTVNMAGYSPWNDAFNRDKVYFKDDVRVYLFLAEYNYLEKNKGTFESFTITIYFNGTGLRVDSENTMNYKKQYPFKISGTKLDCEPYDPEEDNPDSGKYNPPFVIDPSTPPVNADKPLRNFFQKLANLFNTSVEVIYTALIAFGAGIIIFLFIYFVFIK